MGWGAAHWTPAPRLSLRISCPAQLPSPVHDFQQVPATICFRDQVTSTGSEEHHGGGFAIFSWATGGTGADLPGHTHSPLRAPLPGVRERPEGSLSVPALRLPAPTRHRDLGAPLRPPVSQAPAARPGFWASGHRGPFSEGGLLHHGVEELNHKLLTPREMEQLPRAGLLGLPASQRAHLQPTGAPGPRSRDPTAHPPALQKPSPACAEPSLESRGAGPSHPAGAVEGAASLDPSVPHGETEAQRDKGQLKSSIRAGLPHPPGAPVMGGLGCGWQPGRATSARVADASRFRQCLGLWSPALHAPPKSLGWR